MTAVILKSGREKILRRRHPWIFSGAIEAVSGSPAAGATVEILSSQGERLGRGAFSPQSQIRVRIWSFEPDEEISPAFFRHRILQALQAREFLFSGTGTTAYRLINAESDGLPGLIVDRYGPFLVCQFLSSGIEHWKAVIVKELSSLSGTEGAYERSDADVRVKEGLKASVGVLQGAEPPDLVEIQEANVRFLVDIRRGQKTGFYLDQRENRIMAAKFSAGAEVLNGFSYTGGFGIWALKGGARRVTNVDSSENALALGRKSVLLNGMDPGWVEDVTGDVFKVLRSFRDRSRQFDLVVLDPPKFAESIDQVEKAARAYKDINLLAFKLLRPGGFLFTFSCSGHVGRDLFQKIVADAALDAGRDAAILHHLGQAPDHPVGLAFPEGAYLKGLVCRVATGRTS